MLYLPTHSLDANYYFALEEYLMTLDHLNEELFMIWQTDLTVMLGNFQNAYSELNLSALEKDSVTITRRNTGGGTIFTDRGGWQYSFICPRRQGQERHEDIDFQHFMSLILSSLQNLGIPAEVNSRNDLAINGKKISGNAQCFRGNFTLHHGSLLYDSDLSAMAAYLNPAKHKLISKGIKSIKERTANIKDYCPQDWTADQFKEALISQIIGTEAKVFTLSESDEKAIQKIKKEKFQTWDWVFGRNPQFTFVQEAVLPGGQLRIHCEVKQGAIQSCLFEGDFFTAQDLDHITEGLKGLPFNREIITDYFLNEVPSPIIYHISNQEIINTLFKQM